MDRKICKYCNEEKEIKQFTICSTVDGKVYRRHRCNSCRYEQRNERKDKIRAYIKELKSSLCCAHCGENHPATLDFHHTNSEEKDLGISDVIGNGWALERIKKEINKCTVLCANCHRKVHHLGVGKSG